MDQHSTFVAFHDKKIRRTWYQHAWHFSVVDVIAVLTDSPSPRQYWGVLKGREPHLLTNCLQLKLPSSDGKSYFTDCATTEAMFRIIQSIPSRKAEPFKLWLAKVGYERVQEIENPELSQQRIKDIYRAKGYADDWIEKRVRGIAIRDELTDEWKKRGVSQDRDFAILTSEISKATFGMTPQEYKQFKGLDTENLRDHMNDLELIFTMLGERVSTEVTRTKDAHGYPEVEDAAKRGGKVAGNARQDTEHELGHPISTSENYLGEAQSKKKISHGKPSVSPHTR